MTPWRVVDAHKRDAEGLQASGTQICTIFDEEQGQDPAPYSSEKRDPVPH
jgi:hypothetical protein